MFDSLLKLALQISPESSISGLRLMHHQPGWPVNDGTLAYMMSGTPLAVRDYLQTTGEWDGRWGHYLVFVEPPSVELLVHELAHIVPAQPAILDTIGPATAEQRERYEQHSLRVTASCRTASVPWQDHDCRFVRRALHLAHRAERLGHEVNLFKANIAGDHYGLSHPSNYRDELYTELISSEFRSFAQIEKTPMPPRFLRLFFDDVLTFHRNQLLETYAQ